MRTLNYLILFALLGLPLTRSAVAQDHRDAVSPVDRDAVLQAIADEIYVHHLQGYVADVGKHVSGSEYQLGVYLNPELKGGNVGWVIYKLMPYGQVLRMYTLRSDGLAVLYGKLSNRFPPTEPSYLTVYMSDDQLCRLEHEWAKYQVRISTSPSPTLLQEAIRRQRARVGGAGNERPKRK